MKKTCFSYWLVGLKRDPCLPGSGRTQAPRKVSLPEAATPLPPGLQLHVHYHVHSRPPGPLGAHSRQPPRGGLVLPQLPSATTATEDGCACVWVCLQRFVDWGGGIFWSGVNLV